MATLKTTTQLTTTDPFRILWLPEASSVSHGATQFTVSFPLFNQTWRFTGSGFNNFIDGVPQAGTVTGATLTGDSSFKLTGVSLPILKLLTFVTNSDVAGLNHLVFAGDDTITGSAYNDILDGFGGNDTIIAGRGPDEIHISAGRDTVNGGTEIDTVYYDRDAVTKAFALSIGFGAMLGQAGAHLSDGSVVSNVERFVVSAGAGADVLTVTDFANIALDVGVAYGVFWGNGGIDRLVINAASTTLAVSVSPNVQDVFVGNYRIIAHDVERFSITGGSAGDLLRGAGGADNLDGRSGVDLLIGESGNDVLNGGRGADTLVGGDNHDTFVFNTPLGPANIDHLTDFKPGADFIQLDHSVFSALAPGVLAADAFWKGTAAHDADDRIIFDSSTGALLYDPDGSGAADAVQFATIGAAPNLTNAAFTII